MSEELRPCPFCGSEAFYIKIMGNYEKPHEIYCSKCDGAITEGRSEKQVVTNWNTRPIEDALQSRIAELEAESERFTVHSDIERQDDKSPNDTQTQTIVYGKWIPVSERLPEVYRDGDGEFIPFLVCENDKDYPYRAIYDGLNWGDGMFVADVTHWMPLPKPPEVQE